MPASPFFEEAAALCKANPGLSIGLHLTVLGSRVRPVLRPEEIPSIVTKQGFFNETLEQFVKAAPDIKDVEKEFRAQITKAEKAGVKFVYLDWHRNPPENVRELVKKLCVEKKLLFGQATNGMLYGFRQINHDIESWPFKSFPDGQMIYYLAPSLTSEKKDQFYRILNELGPGKHMLVMHPGLAGPERASVTELITSPGTMDIIKRKNIRLVSYNDLWKENFITKK
jgi:hypothetical protein